MKERLQDWWDDHRVTFVALGIGVGVGLALAVKMGRTEVKV